MRCWPLAFGRITWGLLGIYVNCYHFLLVEGMVSENGFTAMIFNYLFLYNLLCE